MLIYCTCIDDGAELEPSGLVRATADVAFDAILRCPQCGQHYRVHATLGRIGGDAPRITQRHHDRRGERVA